jgi:hypothetical protein
MKHFLCVFAVAAFVLGCGSEPTDDDSRCSTSGEFGNTGCGEVAGLVTDTTGAPIGGAIMYIPGAVDPDRPITLLNAGDPSKSDGSYRLHVIRFDGLPPTTGPDTVTVWLRGAVPPPLGSPDDPSLIDSVQVTLELRPVGSMPVVVQAATLIVRKP